MSRYLMILFIILFSPSVFASVQMYVSVGSELIRDDMAHEVNDKKRTTYHFKMAQGDISLGEDVAILATEANGKKGFACHLPCSLSIDKPAKIYVNHKNTEKTLAYVLFNPGGAQDVKMGTAADNTVTILSATAFILFVGVFLYAFYVLYELGFPVEILALWFVLSAMK